MAVDNVIHDNDGVKITEITSGSQPVIEIRVDIGDFRGINAVRLTRAQVVRIVPHLRGFMDSRNTEWS